MEQIVCKDITLGYDGHEVCKNLSFTINSGDYVCIVGDNGSGKSTLLKALLSLKMPDCGTIEFKNGISRKDIGYLPQQSETQKDFPARVDEVVISGCTSKLGKRFFMGRREKLDAVQSMKTMEIYDLAKESFRNLSGGQQQRVLLARALCAAGRIIILDEPVSGLDPNASASMYSLIRHLNLHMKVTVIMVTHDIENSLRDANKVLRMSSTPEFFESSSEYIRKYLLNAEGGIEE